MQNKKFVRFTCLFMALLLILGVVASASPCSLLGLCPAPR